MNARPTHPHLSLKVFQLPDHVYRRDLHEKYPQAIPLELQNNTKKAPTNRLSGKDRQAIFCNEGYPVFGIWVLHLKIMSVLHEKADVKFKR